MCESTNLLLLCICAIKLNTFKAPTALHTEIKTEQLLNGETAV